MVHLPVNGLDMIKVVKHILYECTVFGTLYKTLSHQIFHFHLKNPLRTRLGDTVISMVTFAQGHTAN